MDAKDIHLNLDKYYTKRSLSKKLFNILKNFIIDENLTINNNFKHVLFVEPSAGNGSFLEALNDFNSIGFDLLPDENNQFNIIKNDFLTEDINLKLNKDQINKEKIFIGNPPFGKKSKIAIDFINTAFKYSNIVAFIVPVQFRKWSVQSKINDKAKLVLDIDLEEDAFEFMGKPYKLRCCFQVWIKDIDYKGENIRIKEKPPTQHKDFQLYQYNRTVEAEKYFDYDWDFAVGRQGYLDYNQKIFKKEEIDPKKQWIFFKANNKEVLDNLFRIDFEKLSKKNIGIPGFGKADVIIEYSNILKK
jgi:hypothetical protein